MDGGRSRDVGSSLGATGGTKTDTALEPIHRRLRREVAPLVGETWHELLRRQAGVLRARSDADSALAASWRGPQRRSSPSGRTRQRSIVRWEMPTIAHAARRPAPPASASATSGRLLVVLLVRVVVLAPEVEREIATTTLAQGACHWHSRSPSLGSRSPTKTPAHPLPWATQRISTPVPASRHDCPGLVQVQGLSKSSTPPHPLQSTSQSRQDPKVSSPGEGVQHIMAPHTLTFWHVF
jgi:hypothetical protein